MQSEFLERNYLVNKIDGFSLPGTEKAHYWCGIWQTFGCLNHKKAYVKQFKKTCFRPNCKVCYVSWASRQANRSVKKLNNMKNGNKLHHVLITIPQAWNKETKKHLIKSLKSVGVEAACIIYTPFDESEDGKFFLKTTLHLFYYGKLKDLYSLQAIHFHAQFDLDGTNKTLFKILQSQYLNAGIKKGLHFVSWIGKAKYCTLSSDEVKNNGRNCPICNKKLKLIYFNGDIAPLPPDISFSGTVVKANWKYCPTDSILIKFFRKIKRKILKLKTLLKNKVFSFYGFTTFSDVL